MSRVMLVAAYLALLGLAIPWYWPADNHAMWFGFPGWVIVAIVVSFAASLLTAVLLSRPWPHEDIAGDE